jgi:hypothetical protein
MARNHVHTPLKWNLPQEDLVKKEPSACDLRTSAGAREKLSLGMAGPQKRLW